MVHRSIIGSLERAVAHLIDIHGGAFPPWLAPTQLIALPITDAELQQAQALVRAAIDQGLRAELREPENGSLGARIRANRLVPYQAIIGPNESAGGDISLRLRDGRKLAPMPAAEALHRIRSQVNARQPGLWDAPCSS